MASARAVEFRLNAPSRARTGSNELQLYVIFTNLKAVKPALAAARDLACDLGAQLTLLVAQVVPYPLPLERPPVSSEFTEKRFYELVSDEPEVTVKVHLCRDRTETIRQVLAPDSIVVIGNRKHWWPFAERKLARVLRRDGHQVILVDTKPVLTHLLSEELGAPPTASPAFRFAGIDGAGPGGSARTGRPSH